MVPENLKYTKEHEWVKIEGNEAVVGITDHAQSELGDITFVELPGSGKEINQGDSIATVESVKAASDIYAPLSGKIIGVNELLEGKPETINQDPFGDGWICKIEIKDPQETENLLDASAYEEYSKEL